MASRVFDRLFEAALAEAGEVSQLARQLTSTMAFSSAVDCFRLAGMLHAAGAEFFAGIDRVAAARQADRAASRRLAGKPPLPPFYQQVVEFLTKKAKELPW